MENLTSILIAVVMSVFVFWYIYEIFTSKVRPSLSTWIIYFIGTSLSLITYLSASNWDFASNFVNVMDPLVSASIIIAVILFSKAKVKFNSFEKWYLTGGALIIIFWGFSSSSFVSNLLTQLLIFVSYFPTIQKIITEKTKTESRFAWSMMLLAGVIAIFPAVASENLLSIIYAERTILMPSIIIFLLFLIDRNSAKAKLINK